MRVKERNLLLFLFPLLLAGLLGLTGVLLWRQRVNFEKVYFEESRLEINQEMDVILHFILPRLEISDWEILDEFCDVFAVGGRSIAFFNDRGDAILASGNANLRAVDMELPEIAEARRDGLGIHVRKDEQTGNRSVFAAALANVRGRSMIIHLVTPNVSVSKVLHRANLFTLFVMGSGAFFVALLSWRLFQTVYRPLNQLQLSAERIAAGELETPLAIPSKGAVRELALSISSMAEQLRLEINRVQLQEKLRREFIANVSHEIRTPLTGIMSALQLLDEDGLENKEQLTRCHEILARQTQRMNQLVGDVLKVTRLEKLQEREQEIIDSFQPVALDAIVQDAVRLSRDTAQQAGITITLTNQLPMDFEPIIFGNKDLLEQAVQNLITNAIRYSGSASIDIFLAGSENQTDGENQAILTVRDYGIGIPQSLSERIFERFFRIRRLDGSQNSEGSGLGLAIVRQIVLAHNGTVALVPVNGPGCCFELKFPFFRRLND